MIRWETIAAAIAEQTGQPFSACEQRPIGGGCINESWRISDGRRAFFIKLNRAQALGMFEAEADGLRELAAARAIRVPAPIATGTSGRHAWLALEMLELGGRGSGAELGRQLAMLHRHQAERFGWFRDNTIGSSAQANAWHHDWATFWATRRLTPQLEWAAQRGASGDLIAGGERLLARLPALFADYRPLPSLLHGDLWSGNRAWTAQGEPVIFDPAVYYGDRETDLAMTELFGGFGADFYHAYQQAWPLDPGYAVRKTLYNLYHVLNHYNLFGGGYAGQALAMIKQLTR